jgi:hypothetical protein
VIATALSYASTGSSASGVGLAAPGRVVERQVEAAEGVDRLVDEAFDRGSVGDVGWHCDRASAVGRELFGERRQCGSVACGQRDGHASRDERSRGCGADTATGAGDDARSALERGS